MLGLPSIVCYLIGLGLGLRQSLARVLLGLFAPSVAVATCFAAVVLGAIAASPHWSSRQQYAISEVQFAWQPNGRLIMEGQLHLQRDGDYHYQPMCEEQWPKGAAVRSIARQYDEMQWLESDANPPRRRGVHRFRFTWHRLPSAGGDAFSFPVPPGPPTHRFVIFPIYTASPRGTSNQLQLLKEFRIAVPAPPS